MRRRLLFVSAVALLVAGRLTPALAASTTAFEAQTKREGTNIRAGSTVTAEALVQLPSGSTLDVIGEHAGWYRVRLPKSAQCYVASQYVNARGVVTGSHVNVRAGAGRQCSILGQVQHGNQLTVMERRGEWARIQPPATLSGWIRADLVAPLEHSSTPAEAAAAPASSASSALPAVTSTDATAASTSSAGLAATTVAALATAAEPPTTGVETSKAPTATGVLEPTRGFLQPTKHRLTQAGQTTHYLRTNQDVSAYRHVEVRVWGVVDAQAHAAHPVVVVERLERAH